MNEQVITKQKCLRCGYAWYPRSAILPAHCTNCNSPYWFKQIVRKSVSKARKKA